MSKIRNGGLDQYDAEPFEQQQFGTAGVEGVNIWRRIWIQRARYPIKMPSFRARDTIFGDFCHAF